MSTRRALRSPVVGRDLAIVALLLPLAGCAPEGNMARGDEVVHLVAGTGEDEFLPVDPGQLVPLMKGPQGGYHLWIALRCGGCEGLTVVKYGVRDTESSGSISYLGLRQQVAFSDPGFWQDVPGLIGHLVSTEPTDSVGRRATLWVSLHRGPDAPAFAEAEADVQIDNVVEWQAGQK